MWAGKVSARAGDRPARGRARAGRREKKDVCEENNNTGGAPAGVGAEATCGEGGAAAYTFKAGPAPAQRPPAARAAAPAPRSPAARGVP